MKIIKRINNNAVLCLDGDGNRVVALGSGLGHVKLHEELDLDLVDHTFYDIEPRYVDLLRDLPADHIELAARIADMARAMLSYELSPHLDIALADHISFAIKRSKEGIYLQMPFTYDIQQSYPVEYKIAEYAVRLVKSDLGVFLPSTEASGIAMSIVNSAVAPSGQASAEQARRQEDMLERVTGIVEAEMDVHVDREGFGFSRFATHVQYLMRRVLDGDAIASENSSIYVQLALDNPEVSACVDVIASMIEEEYETVLTEEEKLYLILHVNRICARSDRYTDCIFFTIRGRHCAHVVQGIGISAIRDGQWARTRITRKENIVANNKQIAADVLEAVGGKKNVSFVTHCMTRLRFTLKDRSVVDEAQVKKIKGVLGAQESGGQYQIIIGQNVPKVYDELCTMSGLAKQDAIDENLDGAKEQLTPKAIGRNVMNYLSGSMVPMIPVLLSVGLFKTIAVVLGPGMMNVMPAESDLIVFMNMLYNAAFYFMPIYLGYNAAKNIGLTPVLGAFMGGLLMEPSFVALAGEGAAFSVYGIPCTPGMYAQTVLPILLTVPVMHAIERVLRKVMPDALMTVFTPFLTIGISAPICLCLLAPLGSWLGAGLAAFFDMMGSTGGVVSILGGGLLAALWLPMVVTGMHIALIGIAQVAFLAAGSDSFIFVAIMISLWACFGSEVAGWLKLRKKEEKQAAFGYLVAQLVGGVGEPWLYGMSFRYPKLFVCSIVGSFVSGATALALGVTAYVLGLPSNVMVILTFMGGDAQNIINACIAAAAGFVVSFVATWFFGFTEDELENGPVADRS